MPLYYLLDTIQITKGTSQIIIGTILEALQEQIKVHVAQSKVKSK